MPSIKELMTPQTVGILIYSELMPIPGGVLDQVEKAEKAFELLGGAMPERASKVAPGKVEKTPRQRASMNNDIISCLSTAPMKMWTPKQVLSAIKSAYPKQTTETVQTRLKNNAWKPGMWIVGQGNKYGMPGATTTTKANGSTTEANANVVPAPAALPGEKAQPRVYAYIEAHPGYTKAQVIAAFETSPDPIKANHTGVAIGRLKKSKTITDSKDGPYWPLRAAKPTTDVGGVAALA